MNNSTLLVLCVCTYIHTYILDLNRVSTNQDTLCKKKSTKHYNKTYLCIIFSHPLKYIWLCHLENTTHSIFQKLFMLFYRRSETRSLIENTVTLFIMIKFHRIYNFLLVERLLSIQLSHALMIGTKMASTTSENHYQPNRSQNKL